MQTELIKLQEKLQKKSVFITHDINEEFKLGDRIAVMKDGHVVQIGTPEEIIDEPANDYIVDFIQDIDRSKVFQASHVMIEPRVTAKLNETLNAVASKMRDSSLSSMFFLDDSYYVIGIDTY